MKQAVLYQTGSSNSFKIQKMEPPELKKDHILVKVDHAGVAFADVMMRHGKYPGAPKLPFAPGYDICGIVQKVGDSVTGISVGDKVIALTRFGGYSQLAVVHYKRAVKVSQNINSAEAAALVLNYISAYQMLSKYKNLKTGNKILIHSAAGGVGTAAAQIGSFWGLKVYGTCSTKKKSIVEQCGGIPIDYTKNDFVPVLRDLEPDGFDIILDPIGGRHWLRSKSLLNRTGILIGYGFFSMFNKDKVVSGLTESVKLILSLIFKSGLPGGKKFKLYSINPNNHKEIQDSLKNILEMYLNRKIKPVIYKIYNLEDVSKAHFDLANSISYGKIILNCNNCQ